MVNMIYNSGSREKERQRDNYLCGIYPKSIAIGSTTFQRKVIGIHGTSLASVVASLVSVFFIHVIGNPDLRKHHWVIAHVVPAFFAEELELVPQTVSDSRLANLERECRGKVLAPKDTNDIYIVESIPAVVSTLIINQWDQRVLTNAL